MVVLAQVSAQVQSTTTVIYVVYLPASSCTDPYGVEDQNYIMKTAADFCFLSTEHSA